MRCDPTLSIPKRLCIIDYGMGNIGSVLSAINFFGVNTDISCDPKTLKCADGLILPGVGSFSDGMENLESRGLIPLLNKLVLKSGQPLLGICLGMQVMAQEGLENGLNPGLGWLNGTVKGFTKQPGFRVPNVGWLGVTVKSSVLFDGIREEPYFYFDHSFFLESADYGIASARVGDTGFIAAIERGNIFGTQFHPEKSDWTGLKVLRNFLNYVVQNGKSS